MPRTWISALSDLVEHWNHLDEWREARLKPVRAAAWQLQDERRRLLSKMHPDVKKVIGHLHLPLLRWMVVKSKYDGIRYVERLTHGKPCLGDIPPSGAFRRQPNVATMTLKESGANPRSRSERMIRSVGSSGDEALDAAAWEKTMEEVSMSYRKGPRELSQLDLDKICLAPR